MLGWTLASARVRRHTRGEDDCVVESCVELWGRFTFLLFVFFFLLFESRHERKTIEVLESLAAGKVEIGAFRTYPQGYKPPDESQSKYQTIPMNKIEDFGVHANQYYSLAGPRVQVESAFCPAV